jgi:integrase
MNIRLLVNLWRQRRGKELSFESAQKVYAMTRRWEARWGDREAKTVTPTMIEAYRLRRDDGKRKAGVLNRERGELRAFFEFVKDLGYRPDNPVTTWKHQKEVVEREYVVLTPREEDALVMQLGDDLLCRYVRFSVATGLRQGTIRRLDWGMVKNLGLVIPAGIMKMRKPLEMPLSTKAWEAIALPKESPAFAYPLHGQNLLFPGLPSQQKIHRLVKEAAARAGLSPHLTPHDFRRTWVARLRDAGADMYDVMKMGGWEAPGVLIKHYFGQVPEKKARELLEAI